MFDEDIFSRKRTDAPTPEKAKPSKSSHKPYEGSHANEMTITITENGPYIAKGSIPLNEDAICESADGSHLEYHRVRDFDVQETYALCK